MILRNEVEFAVGYSEPNAGSDAASMRLKAERARARRQDRLAPQRPEDVDDVGALRRVVLARHAHRSRQQAPRHHADARAARPARHHDQRHLDDGRRAHQRGLHRRRVRARRVRRRRGEPRLPVHLAGARPRALHDVHVLADQAAPRPADATTCAPTERDGEPLQGRPGRSGRDIARLATDAEVARVLGPAGRRRVDEGREDARARRRRRSSRREYKLFATEFSRRLANASMDIGGPGTPAAGQAPRTRRWRAGPSRRTATR